MIGQTSGWRHALVGTVIAVGAFFACIGWVAVPTRPEKIAHLQVTVMPAGDDGLRVREVIDQDFGTAHRHGPELLYETDFGMLQNVTASSDTAPDAVSVALIDGKDRIRIGDKDVEVTGQHRYVLEYTYPNALISTGHLGLDVVGATSDIPIEDVDVIVTGMTLDHPTCNVGGAGTSGGCTFSDAGAGYRTHVDRLDKHQGITIAGDIVNRTGITMPDLPPTHDGPDRPTVPWALVVIGVGTVVAAVIFLWARRAGANEIVGGGGAAEAAGAGYGPLPAGTPTQKVTDAELAGMTTIEFAPPPDLEPWQGAIALRERVDIGAATAWFSGAAAHDYLVIKSSGSGETTSLEPGPRRSQADPFSAKILDSLFRGRDEITLGSYDSHFATAWRKVSEDMVLWAQTSGWWSRNAPQASTDTGATAGPILRIVGMVVLAGLLVPVMAGLGAIVGALTNVGSVGKYAWIGGLVIVAALIPAAVARAVYGRMLPSRTAAGSAAALRTESFRRFLVESEAQHVEWAWDHGVIRQYSAWAVALGAADAWRKAMEASGIPREEVDYQQVLLNGAMSRTFVSSSIAPSTSSSSSGFSSGGFSGGSVGGGGGGGSHGSW